MSEEMKTTPVFTPGPWKAEMHGANVLACDDQMMICNVRGWGYLTGIGGLNLPDSDATAIQDANVRLIAAAPALFDALQDLLRMVDAALNARDVLLVSKTCATWEKAVDALAIAAGQNTDAIENS